VVESTAAEYGKGTQIHEQEYCTLCYRTVASFYLRFSSKACIALGMLGFKNKIMGHDRHWNAVPVSIASAVRDEC